MWGIAEQKVVHIKKKKKKFFTFWGTTNLLLNNHAFHFKAFRLNEKLVNLSH